MGQTYQGVGGAQGIAIGRVLRYLPTETATETAGETTAIALERFAAAQQAASSQLSNLEQELRAEGRTSEADILDAQVLFVDDIAITDEVIRRVETEAQPLEQALDETVAALSAEFAALDDAYLSERAADIRAVGRLLRATLRGAHSPLQNLTPDTIIITTDLTPAETAELRGGAIAGFATAHGGPTGHTAILARSLHIPAVVGLGDAILELADGTEVILNGDAQTLIAAPEAAERATAERQLAEQQAVHQRQQALRSQPGQLADGHPVGLWANIGRPDEAAQALDEGAEGIGLFRTEFLFLKRDTPPTEEEQYTAYRTTLETMGQRPVVIRTIDIGGDKPIPYLQLPAEPNPFLGVRGLRLCMAYPDLFQVQLRALLRAAPYGNLWIMLPMVATRADVRWARQQLQLAAADLVALGVEHHTDTDVRLGIMIETPAAAVTADLLAQEVDFLSVGSNDLTQYTMAVDRGNAQLAANYAHTEPAVFRLIGQAATAAKQANIPLGICGELGGVPEAAVVLAGLGLAELSMSPAAIPGVKERLCAYTLSEAQVVARQAMEQAD